MKTALWLGILLMVASIAAFAAMRHAAKQQWPETAKINFGAKLNYDAATVSGHMARHRDDVRRYIFPGLFGFDLAFLFCFGGTIALLSLGLAGDKSNIGMLLILPVGYMMADLLENLLLALMLSGDPPVHDGSITLIKSVSIIKHLLWICGGLQTLWLVWAAYQRG